MSKITVYCAQTRQIEINVVVLSPTKYDIDISNLQTNIHIKELLYRLLIDMLDFEAAASIQ